MKKYIIIFSSGILIFLNACRHDSDLASLPQISFANNIQPIIASNCTQSGCHNSQGDSRFPLVTYNDVMTDGKISAGNAHGSTLYNSISNHGTAKLMPPAPLPTLSEDQIKLIFIWIEQGAKNN